MKPGTVLLGFRAWLFVSIARVSAYLPAVRGRTRVFLILHGLLGLRQHRLLVDARLRRPVPYKARLDIQSWLQRIAFLTGDYESETAMLLQRFSASRGRSGYLLDIGANVGMISLPFALMARGGAKRTPSVIAVEAVPDNARELRLNVALNGLDSDIEVIECALGDEEKEIRIQVEGDLAAGEGSGTANILADQSTYQCVTQSLRLLTLDGLLEAGRIAPDCTIIKIDTDGYDLKILQGAEKFLTAARPIIFGEFLAHCLNWHEQSIDDVRLFAERLNYVVLYRQMDGTSFADHEPAAGYVQDLILVPGELRTQMSWCESPGVGVSGAGTSVVETNR